MGIVGLGHIGMRVARIACDLGMDVFALTSKNASDLPEGIQKTTLEGVLAVSDILSLHCPLTKDTWHLIDAKRLKLMHPSAILINTAADRSSTRRLWPMLWQTANWQPMVLT